ncbi:permease for cytosine/purines, uracil, thiamine, allantoin-domain-containing protein [Lipomyces tetrasporus]|uniref:Permease for cytosine/purines, uracil, thiamine, allantoin-domain-containing protein n=1 Tax=Lipomyces tetrasporus TaxID=54092 RepID=A0AAD7QW42_9ASCO|nr:permease for cytosine/purines, uracil, thiamine, allantoin-domain-containing protein [Lipomyces tetrasporus]KAJ8100967.1 permease for cytosine/purines, uracil, thiamine, allantoin-domain-containing protein [Lipomyces tetrasporus]
MTLRNRFDSIGADIKAKATSRSAWVLPKESSSFAPPDTWTNKDNDVTPASRRTWTAFTILGFWFSDALNMQGWEAPASIIAVGLTWREAILCNCLGMIIVAIPLIFNGAIGANLHVPYPVAARSGFGFQFAKFAVIVRFVTALFWHSIQTFSGSFALTNCISAIWPSYLNIPNHIPESVGLTTQQMVSHVLFWCIQFPILMIPPHKLRWFFIFKAVVVMASCIGVAAGMVKYASSNGDIWAQEPRVHGSQRAWLIMTCMMSSAGGWATMATNIPDFTRYMQGKKGQFWQALFLPVISTFLAVMSIVATSAGKVVYGEYIWDPTVLAAMWTGPKGRTARFFVGFAWVVGQIGTNLSANVITAANDLTSLFPKYINIRRGAVIVTIIAGWIMQPWKIINSAASLLTFMAGLAIFLAPVAGVLASDYWLVKRRKIDVPGLYDPHGRYEYWHGLNWRALVAFVVSLGPNLPGLANSVSPSLGLTGGIVHLWDVNYLYGFYVAVFVYVGLSLTFPAKETFVPEMISGDVWPGTVDAESEIIEGIGEEGSLDTSEEKKQVEVESEKF